ncbi:hypothetical protein T440DRAFT_532280 [Plenodomus tracheiphilus IPT5]|uniref:Uncharacterized protein n=1 Tax=Plenodomus tracheiphilus IPT5 TaxID=1408161 RepID=A0A6A7B6N7_9PLEO|nr:hypothetical protein T440DRAFT_532280 [Plenodomus tracheiphilus IPT5]
MTTEPVAANRQGEPEPERASRQPQQRTEGPGEDMRRRKSGSCPLPGSQSDPQVPMTAQEETGDRCAPLPPAETPLPQRQRDDRQSDSSIDWQDSVRMESWLLQHIMTRIDANTSEMRALSTTVNLLQRSILLLMRTVWEREERRDCAHQEMLDLFRELALPPPVYTTNTPRSDPDSAETAVLPVNLGLQQPQEPERLPAAVQRRLARSDAQRDQRIRTEWEANIASNDHRYRNSHEYLAARFPQPTRSAPSPPCSDVEGRSSLLPRITLVVPYFSFGRWKEYDSGSS